MRPWRDHLPAGDELLPDRLTAPGTLLRAWSEGWQASPRAPLLLDVAGGGASGSGRPDLSGGWWRAEAFDEATRGVAVRLRRAGLRPGDRVLWSTSSSVAALCAHVGALRAGMVVVPANPAFLRRELVHIVDDVRPAAAVVERPDQAEWIRTASPQALVTGTDVDLPEVDPRGAGPDPLDAAEPDAPALIVYTSGTTGPPKGAVLTHRNLLAGAESLRIAWRWSPDDRLIHCLPVFHVHGLCVGVYGTLLAGASMILQPGFDPESVADAATAGAATMFFGVPTMYHRLVSSGRASDLKGLRLCVSGSAALSPELNAAASAAVGSAVLERYGMTETLLLSSNPYEGERRPGTVGFPLPGVDIQFGEGNEVLVRGPNVFGGYWERPAANADAFLLAEDGPNWFRAGDIGTDDGGYLVIRGRSKELIISGGMNVYPAEIEAVLSSHPGVAEVAVTGTPSDEWGEVVTAWIVAAGRPPTLSDLSDFSAPLLASYKRPRVLHVVDELPRNALGKVVRNRLDR